jgi:pimeloyl-ACP methyl ester carboxylesterase
MTPFRKAVLAVAGMMMLVIATASHANELIEDRTITVGDQTFRYLTAGTDGPPIVLLHGWPESADEFRRIMPELARDHTVYAPNLSGVGGTTAPHRDWRKEALARDIKAFADALKLKKPLLVGHDIGGMVAYAYARQFPEALSGVAILDVPIPGLAPWNDIATSHYAWHFDFNDQVGLAEKLVAGQQTDYFRYFIDSAAANPGAISDADIAIYASAYGTDDQLRAGFEFYRAFDKDAAFFRSHDGPLNVPMLILGGEHSMQAALPVMAESFAAHGITNIKTLAIAGSGHWLAEEQPDATAAAIADFACEVFKQQEVR